MNVYQISKSYDHKSNNENQTIYARQKNKNQSSQKTKSTVKNRPTQNIREKKIQNKENILTHTWIQNIDDTNDT